VACPRAACACWSPGSWRRKRRHATLRLYCGVGLAPMRGFRLDTPAAGGLYSGLSNLQWLRLGETQVTDGGLLRLNALFDLESPGLSHTQIPDVKAGSYILRGSSSSRRT
jgi:hypothetical protein